MKLYISGPMAGHEDDNYPAFDAMAKHLRSLGHDVISPAETSRITFLSHGGRPAFEAEYDTEPKRRSFFMKVDTGSILEVEGIVILPYWHTSRGATYEVLVGVQAGMPIYYTLLEDPSGELFNMNMTHAQAAEKHFIAERHADKSYQPTAAAQMATANSDKKTGASWNQIDALRHIGSASGVSKGDPAESITLEADRLVDGARQAAYGHPLDNYERVAVLWNGYQAGISRDTLTAEDVITMMALMKIGRLMNGPHRDSIVDIAGYAKCLDLCRQERSIRQVLEQERQRFINDPRD